MKKIYTTIVMAFAALTAFAQANQQYFRVEFTVPITGDKIPVGQSNNSVAATMKDEYTFCNPEHDYLDFQAQNPMGFRPQRPLPKIRLSIWRTDVRDRIRA